MVPYRIKQFYWAVVAIIKKDDINILHNYLNKDEINSCIRMSFSGKESKEELIYICHILKSCVNTLREIR